MHKILIIEDDQTICNILKRHLSKWGYEVRAIDNFQDILEEFIAFDPQLVLLDIGLPYFNGHHWCCEIRRISKVPIIFLSSADDNLNIVMALNMGGDDFIAKPFDLNVVTAKVQAILRRSYAFKDKTNLIEHRGAVLNLNDATLTFEKQRIELTKNEYRIMQILMSRAGEIVSRDEIMRALWEDDSFVDDNTLTVNVARLRKKLDEAGLSDYIKTKKGIGYVVEA
ncbi:response regulator transcription factor [bacterium 210820-DFI.6.37]|nr:response regulator transcription factor [bacterium 210820-DFI.6.37]